MSWAAVVLKNAVVTWPGVFAALGALCAALIALGLWLWRGEDPRGLGVFFPVVVLFSLVLVRLLHWYSHPLQYGGFLAAMTDYLRGGLSLSGVFAGTLLAAILTRCAGLVRNLPRLLDALAPGAAFGVAVGRLGFLFDLSDRGKFVLSAPGLRRLPFAAFTALAGETGEWRFATFLWQAAVCAVLGAGLLWLFFRLPRRDWHAGVPREGHVFALFLALYGAAQIVLDSTRYDADFLRSNGFIHVPQLLAAGALVLVLVWYSVWSAWAVGPRLWHGLCWVGAFGSVALGAYMEYFVQRRPHRFVLAYGVMSACFLLTGAMVLGLFASLRPGAKLPGGRLDPALLRELEKRYRAMLRRKKQGTNAVREQKSAVR